MLKQIPSKKRKSNINLICISFFIISLINCTSDKNTPELSDIQIDVNIKRFEQELFALEADNSDISFDAQLAQLEAKYPKFYEVFKELVADPYGLDTSSTKRIRQFVQHEGVRKLYDTTQVIYKDIEWIEGELEKTFAYYHHYFPKQPIPEVVSYISEYGIGTFTYGDSLLAIGLDFFLGQSFQYDYNVFPDYIQRSMDKDYLVAKAIEAMASNVAGEVYGERLLDHMIANGKMLYVKSLLLPDYQENIIMEWTPEQLTWMQKASNERELWTQLAKRDLLYSTRRSTFDKLIGPSPSGTTWMPPESPGKTANWIGWQIIKSYMQQHPEMTMEELVQIKDAQMILDASKYRPRRG